MKGLRYVIVGSIAGLAASTVSARASAMCWQRQPGCATSIATDIADRPVVVGCGSGNVYIWEQVTGNCNSGFCPTTFDWVKDGTLAGAQFVSVDPDGEIWVDDTSGQIWRDGSGSVDGAHDIPIGYWWPDYDFAPPGWCLNSFATVEYTAFVGVSSQVFLGTPCGSTDLWYGIYDMQNFNPYQTQAPFPGRGAAQVAGFFNPLFTDGSTAWVPWAVAQDGTLWAFDGSTWDEQPGWNAVAITDHFAVADDGNIYEWDDHAPNFLPGQAANGNWSGPVIGPTPSGIPWQIAHASDAGNAQSSLWAIDYSGGIWKMQQSCAAPPR
jgi:hypothetical protein